MADYVGLQFRFIDEISAEALPQPAGSSHVIVRY